MTVGDSEMIRSYVCGFGVEAAADSETATSVATRATTRCKSIAMHESSFREGFEFVGERQVF